MIKLTDILKYNNKINEKKDAVDFNRTEFYQQYYKNISPSDFIIQSNGDTITIKITKNNKD